MAENFWFKARYSWGSGFSALDDKSVANLARAIWKLAATGEDTDLSGTESAIWYVIRDDIIRDANDRENGSKGGRPRGRGKNPPLNRGLNPPFTEQSISEQSISEQSISERENVSLFNSAPPGPVERLEKKPKKDAPGFDAFYSAYPKHQGKEDARKAWNALSPDEELQAVILAAVRDQQTSPEWKKDGGKFIPLPASWLRGKRWEDETSAPKPLQHSGLNLGVTV